MDTNLRREKVPLLSLDNLPNHDFQIFDAGLQGRRGSVNGRFPDCEEEQLPAGA